MSASVKFIGTGSGKTSLSRFHSSILFRCGNHALLVDTGDGISKALLSANVGFDEIDSIFITHSHADHFSGIGSLITQMKLAGRTKKLGVFIHKQSVEPLNSLLDSCYMFSEILGFEMTVTEFEYENRIEVCPEFELVPRKNSHVKNHYHLDVPDERFQSAGLFVEAAGTRIFYTSDIGGVEDLFLFEEKRPQILITEGTHIPLKEIAIAAEKISPSKVIITHIPDEMETEISAFTSAKNEAGSIEYITAFDGLEIFF